MVGVELDSFEWGVWFGDYDGFLGGFVCVVGVIYVYFGLGIGENFFIICWWIERDVWFVYLDYCRKFLGWIFYFSFEDFWYLLMVVFCVCNGVLLWVML